MVGFTSAAPDTAAVRCDSISTLRRDNKTLERGCDPVPAFRICWRIECEVMASLRNDRRMAAGTVCRTEGIEISRSAPAGRRCSPDFSRIDTCAEMQHHRHSSAGGDAGRYCGDTSSAAVVIPRLWRHVCRLRGGMVVEDSEACHGSPTGSDSTTAAWPDGLHPSSGLRCRFDPGRFRA